MLLLLSLIRSDAADDSVVLYFDAVESRINAYTLASTLVAFADAAKIANADLNHGYDLEIVVEALESGSFKAKLRALYTQANNLFSKHVLLNIVLGTVVAHFTEKAIWPDKRPAITIDADEVVYDDGSTRLIVPRKVYDAGQKIVRQTRYQQAVSKIAEKIVDDSAIRGIGFMPSTNAPKPELIIDREHLAVLASKSGGDDDEKRTVTEQCELQIVGAILVPGRRKWEFIWRGVKITAPILDRAFYERFASHEITIAPGDTLKVQLAMIQERDPKIDVYTTTAYEVLEVFEHIQHIRSSTLAHP